MRLKPKVRDGLICFHSILGKKTHVKTGNCKDCKHWDAQAVSSQQAQHGRRRCLLISEIDDAYQDAGTPSVVLVTGGDEYDDAGLWTRADFGCVLFEKKS